MRGKRFIKAAAAVALAIGGLGAWQVAEAPAATAASCVMSPSGSTLSFSCPTSLPGTMFRVVGICEASPTQGWRVTSGWATQGRWTAVVCAHNYYTLRFETR
jgi:hypothetical protein